MKTRIKFGVGSAAWFLLGIPIYIYSQKIAIVLMASHNLLIIICGICVAFFGGCAAVKVPLWIISKLHGSDSALSVFGKRLPSPSDEAMGKEVTGDPRPGGGTGK